MLYNFDIGELYSRLDEIYSSLVFSLDHPIQNHKKYEYLREHICIIDDVFYEGLTDSDMCRFASTSPFELVDLVKDSVVKFAVAANLYAYVKKEHLSHLENASINYLLSIDVKHSFGGYGYSVNDFHKLLLLDTTEIFPDLLTWVYTLEYCNNCYPCMPDMKWWKEKGKVEVAMKVIVAIREFIDKYPYSIFCGEAEYIIREWELPALCTRLFNEMKEKPEDFSETTIRILLGETAPTDKIYNIETGKMRDFFCHNRLTITISDLVKNDVIRYNEADDLFSNVEIGGDMSILNNHQEGVDFLVVGHPGSGKTTLVNCLHYHLFGIGISPIASEQREEITKYRFNAYREIEHHQPPRHSSSLTTTCIQYMIDKKHVPINIIDEGYNLPLCSAIYGSKNEGKNLLPESAKSHNKKIICLTIDASLFVQNASANIERQKYASIYYLDYLLTLLDYEKIAMNIIGLVVVFTKSEKMKIDKNDLFERIHHISENFCEKWGVNKKNNHKPYIVHYSAGNNLIGGLFRYDFSDTQKLMSLLYELIPSEPWWKRLIINLLQ